MAMDAMCDADKKPWFRAEKLRRISVGDFSCRITAGFRIIDFHGSIIAEAKRKSSSSGVLLGDGFGGEA